MKTQVNPEPTHAAPVSRHDRKESNSYCLGHDAEEIRRLENQGRFLAWSTRDFLSGAGVITGMRVLDVGCGAGDVSFILADLVGPSGEVIGFDRIETVVSIAKARAHDKGLTNVSFVHCDIDHAADLAADGLFDAVVSRLVLAHIASPLEPIRKLLRLVRPGGVVGFQEPEFSTVYWSTQKLPILDQVQSVVLKCIERRMMAGDPLSAIIQAFDETGVVQRRVTRTSTIHSASDDDACAWVGGIAQTTYGIAQRIGVPLPSYDPKTVALDLKREVMGKNALFTLCQWICAAGRLPLVRTVEEQLSSR